jgi:hypothetical protein
MIDRLKIMREKTLQEIRNEQSNTVSTKKKPKRKECLFHIYTRWDEEFRIQMKISKKWRRCHRSPTFEDAQKWIEKDKRSRQFWFSNSESEYIIIDSRTEKPPSNDR